MSPLNSKNVAAAGTQGLASSLIDPPAIAVDRVPLLQKSASDEKGSSLVSSGLALSILDIQSGAGGLKLSAAQTLDADQPAGDQSRAPLFPPPTGLPPSATMPGLAGQRVAFEREPATVLGSFSKASLSADLDLSTTPGGTSFCPKGWGALLVTGGKLSVAASGGKAKTILPAPRSASIGAQSAGPPLHRLSASDSPLAAAGTSPTVLSAGPLGVPGYEPKSLLCGSALKTGDRPSNFEFVDGQALNQAPATVVPPLTVASGVLGDSSSLLGGELLVDADNRRSEVGGVPAENVVDHFSFELTLSRQNPATINTQPWAEVRPGAAKVFLPRPQESLSGSFPSDPDPGTFAELSSAIDPAALRRGLPYPSAEPFASIQTIHLGAAVGSVAELIPSPAASTTHLDSLSSAESVSPKLPIDLPDAARQVSVGTVHEVNLRVQTDSGESVSVRLSDRLGQVQISVRSSDQASANSLRQDLSSLSAGLEKQGWKSDLLGTVLQAVAHEGRDSSNARQSHDQGPHQTPDWQDRPDRKRQNPGDQWADLNEQETK